MQSLLRTSTRWLGCVLALGLAVSACGSSSSDDQPSSYACKNPTPANNAYDSGMVTCEGHWSHRTAAVECQTAVPRADYSCNNSGGPSGCTTDADCAGTPNSYCNFVPPGACECVTGCTKDSDCGAGNLCACDGVMGSCYEARCATDADCGAGNLCGSVDTMPACGFIVFTCQKGSDECASSTDCPNNEACTVQDGHRVCAKVGCYT
ncbi:MAG: hypothetical protein IPI67_37605 [Myxococcales bacterium]|nr:hypothetical protein [Myxococcales bacterium]